MKIATAKSSAQWNANKNGEPYVAIRARNGQWMCEREAFVASRPDLYPEGRERFRYVPQSAKVAS